jgi:hypothetical protein
MEAVCLEPGRWVVEGFTVIRRGRGRWQIRHAGRGAVWEVATLGRAAEVIWERLERGNRAGR